MSLTIGSGPNANSRRSFFSHETEIVLNSGLLRLRKLKLIFGLWSEGKGKPMTIQMILVIVIGVAVAVAAVAYTSRSRKNKEPIQLGVDKKLRQ
jgi:hypothetical protein